MMRTLRTHIVSFVLGLAVLFPAASRASIYDVTGLWFNTNESGWGMNVIQQNSVLFITIFVYGLDGRPTWYVASNTQYVTGTAVKFTGPLYATSGPYFGGAFNPGNVSVRQVGTITFDSTCAGCNIYNNVQVTYSVDGVTVTKNVQQQTWTPITIPSSGYGAMHRVAATTCSGGPGANPVFMTYTVSGTTVTITDANGVRYVVGFANVPQFGATRVGTPSSLSVSNGPTFTQGTVQLESANGVVMNGLITGIAANGCLAQYAFVASGVF
jgi:hypothetical protein